tara:strand:+ start:40 stop:267 length:228 start_codon:yes stop_codon:yes gene_type:complete
MPRRPRVYIPGYVEHIIQRGNNCQPIFACDEDIKAYAYWLREYSEKFEVSIHAWVFMTNHVNLLFTSSNTIGTSK